MDDRTDRRPESSSPIIAKPPQVPIQLPRVWLKAFWGFDPPSEGYLGFTRPGDRVRFLEQARPTDLVLIYGADTKETELAQRKQALGFLQVSLDEIADVDKISPAALALKRERGWSDRWTHAVPVRRAWRINRRIGVRDVAPDTYTADRARVLASQGEMMLVHEAQRALSLPVSPVDVYGEPPVSHSAKSEFQLLDECSPSRGIPPKFGKKEVVTVDGEHYLYMLKLECEASFLLDARQFDLHRKLIVKVGYSNDPIRRCEDHNSSLPPAGRIKYRLMLRSRAYATGQAAKEAEDAMKDALAERCQSLGNEFFLGTEADLQSVFGSAPGAGFAIHGGTSKSPR